LDGLTLQLQPDEKGTLIVVQHMQPDRYFSRDQQQRLEELMLRWRAARDSRQKLAPEEQAELEALVAAEWQAATQRTAALVPEADR
jgi:hypothetical protein